MTASPETWMAGASPAKGSVCGTREVLRGIIARGLGLR